MAERRMFAKSIVQNDSFLGLVPTAQSLYYALCMSADDDGFTDKTQMITGFCGSSIADLDLLIKEGYVIRFSNGLSLITHWNIHNRIRRDRKRDTRYLEEKSMVIEKPDGTYVLIDGMSDKCQTSDGQLTDKCQTSDGQLTDKCPHSIGEGSIGKGSIVKDSIGEGSVIKGSTEKDSIGEGSVIKESTEKDSIGEGSDTVSLSDTENFDASSCSLEEITACDALNESHSRYSNNLEITTCDALNESHSRYSNNLEITTCDALNEPHSRYSNNLNEKAFGPSYDRGVLNKGNGYIRGITDSLNKRAEGYSVGAFNSLEDSIPPTLDEIKDYCVKEKLFFVNRDIFFNHYAAFDWCYPDGKRIKNWQALIKKWNAQDKERRKGFCGGRDEPYGDSLYVDTSKLEA